MRILRQVLEAVDDTKGDVFLAQERPAAGHPRRGIRRGRRGVDRVLLTRTQDVRGTLADFQNTQFVLAQLASEILVFTEAPGAP